MNLPQLAPDLPDRDDWETKTCEALARSAGPAPHHDLSELETILISALRTGTEPDGTPPIAGAVFWFLESMLPASGDDGPDAERLRALFDAFHQINLYTFQTLTSHPDLQSSLMEENPLVAQSLPTEIFLAWYAMDARPALKVAEANLDQRHRAAGLGPLAPIPQATYQRISQIIHQGRAEEIVEFHAVFDAAE